VVCFALTWQAPSAFFSRCGTVAVPAPAPAPALHAGRGAVPAPSHSFLASPVSEHCIGLVLESGRRPRWCGYQKAEGDRADAGGCGEA
jgi:hypothetical protein